MPVTFKGDDIGLVTTAFEKVKFARTCLEIRLTGADIELWVEFLEFSGKGWNRH